MCSSVKSVWLSDVLEQLCDENRSGGLGKSSQEVSESTVEDDEGGEWFGSRSKCGSGSSVGQGGRQVSVCCVAGAADTQEEAMAKYVGAEPPL